MDPSPEVVQYCRKFEIPNEKLAELQCRMLDSIQKGLSKATHDQASIKCYNTYVQDIPTGKESGTYFALDLGGTNFRVLLLTFTDGKFDMEFKTYPLPTSVLNANTRVLFDHIADCLIDFQKAIKIPTDKQYALGFTFSFPCNQIGLDKAILVQWTKGFNLSDGVGMEIGKLLKDALQRKGNNSIHTCAILNDTTGTLMSLAWEDPKVRVGLIVGTGSNACYREKIEKVELFDGDRSKPEVIINLESGNWGAKGEIEDILTDIDRDVDAHSPNRSQQIFEKMVAGMYIGEIVRQSTLHLIDQKIMFNGESSQQLKQRNSFDSRFVTEIENAWNKSKEEGIAHAKKILEIFKMTPSDSDCINFNHICKSVTSRSAKLVSMGISCLIIKIGMTDITIGVDGSVYRYHPHYHNIMNATIKLLVDPKFKYRLRLSEDGSGRGAALVAAAACK